LCCSSLGRSCICSVLLGEKGCERRELNYSKRYLAYLGITSSWDELYMGTGEESWRDKVNWVHTTWIEDSASVGTVGISLGWVSV
jgi:hypothetical protein